MAFFSVIFCDNGVKILETINSRNTLQAITFLSCASRHQLTPNARDVLSLKTVMHVNTHDNSQTVLICKICKRGREHACHWMPKRDELSPGSYGAIEAMP